MSNNDTSPPPYVPGDIVAVKGYAGAFKITNVEAAGTTPQGYTKWLCTGYFGAYNFQQQTGYALKNAPRGKYFGVGRTLKEPQHLLHQFYSGKLEPWLDYVHGTSEHDHLISPKAEVMAMSREELIEALAQMGITA